MDDKKAFEEWFCDKCANVLQSGHIPICCGQKMIHFAPSIHGQRLVSNSNAWLGLKHHEWEENPIYQEVKQKHFDKGSYSAARILNDFVDELLHRIKTGFMCRPGKYLDIIRQPVIWL